MRANQLNEINILLVEDNPDHRNLISNYLAQCDDLRYNLTQADTLAKAKEHLENLEIDVVLLDLNLPDSSGRQTAKATRKFAPDIPIVIITCASDKELSLELLKEGIQDFLDKASLNPQQLNRSIHYSLERNRMLLEMEQQKRELEASQASLRTIIDSNLDGIVILDRMKNVKLANKAAMEILNINEQYHHGFKFEHPFIVGGSREIRVQGDKGRYKIVEIRAAETVWEGALAYIASLRDITNRKIMEEALAAEKERLVVTLRSIGDGVITTDQEGKVFMINEVAEKLTGWKQAEAYGKHFSKVFNVETMGQEVGRKFSNSLTFDTTQINQETILISKNDARLYIEGTVAPIRKPNNAIIGNVIVFRDISERRRIQEDLERVRRLDSLAILAGGIAHDFNNFLTAILGNLSIARLYFRTGKDPQDKLQKAELASLNARELTRQLLIFSKGGAPIKKTTAIQDLLRDFTQFALSGSKVKASFDIEKDLQPVDIDEGQFNQVINNIVINAVQAMPHGGTLTVQASNITLLETTSLPIPKGRYVKISIKDQGQGIPEAILHKIFDPYFTTKPNGTGLGLATTYSIIKNHDGYITVDSEVSKGTTFHIFLPASRKNIEKNQDSDDTTFKSKGKIIIMDDERMILEVAGSMLKEMGFEPIYARDGKEAIDKYLQYSNENVDIKAVIMDLTVPGGMGGKEAIMKLRDIAPNIKAIVSSGYSTDPVMSDYRKYGFDAMVSKPYVFNELNLALREVFEKADER